MYDDYQERSKELATMKNEKKVADDTIILEANERESELRKEKENKLNQNLELFELLVQEKSLSAHLDIQLCETKKTLLSLQTDWR